MCGNLFVLFLFLSDMFSPWFSLVASYSVAGHRSTGRGWFREESGSSHQAEKVAKKAEKVAKTLEHGWYPHPNLLLATSGCDIEAWHWRLMSKTKWFHTPLAMVKRWAPWCPPWCWAEKSFETAGGWIRMERTKKICLGFWCIQPTGLKATFNSSIFHLLLPFCASFCIKTSRHQSPKISSQVAMAWQHQRPCSFAPEPDLTPMHLHACRDYWPSMLHSQQPRQMQKQRRRFAWTASFYLDVFHDFSGF